MTREWDYWKGPETDDAFLRYGYSTGSTLHMVFATLANYFRHPFGDRTQLPALTIRPTQRTFTFSKDQAREIPVEVHFLAEAGAARLLDATDGLDFWGARLITPPAKEWIAWGNAGFGNAKSWRRWKSNRAIRTRALWTLISFATFRNQASTR
jgi:hypothetical protein